MILWKRIGVGQDIRLSGIIVTNSTNSTCVDGSLCRALGYLDGFRSGSGAAGSVGS